MQVQAVPVESTAQLRALIEPGTTVVAIDEVQFFDDQVVVLCEELADHGTRVIVAGLDMDFRGEPFGPVPTLMARAERYEARCRGCHEVRMKNEENGETGAI